MTNKIRVVTGYVPLTVKHMDPARFAELGNQLRAACIGYEFTDFYNYPYDSCWLAQENPPMEAANERAHDRFDTVEQHVRNNVVCNQFVDWASKSYANYQNIDVIVVLVRSVLKQGDFTGKRVQPEHIQDFLAKVEHYNFIDIPFPGITPPAPVTVHGNNWRFCGSTHIWPTKWLPEIERSYKFHCREFIRRHGCVPLDLAIWPAVEGKSGLPFRQYSAEYDWTQFTNFPG